MAAGPYGEFFGTLLGLALGVFFLYLLYGLLHRAFRAVGFTTQQASLIIFGTFLGGLVNVPLAMVNGWVLAVNVGGAVVPLVVSWLLLRQRPHILDEVLVGVALTSIATYVVTDATPEGIVSPFPLWLLPALVAAVVSAFAFWQDRDDAAPVAYVSGTLGALIGADVFRIADFLAQPPPEEGLAFASIGGAAVFDMVFLTGILAVGLDLLFFRQRRKDRVGDEGAPYAEGVVFTSRTPAAVLSGYEPARDHALMRGSAERAGAGALPGLPGASGAPPSPSEAAQGAWRQWQELLRELNER